MPFRVLMLDRYILRQMLATMGAVLTIVMSLMILEHLPRLMEISRWSGHQGYIIMQTVAGLLPEYCGIGLLTGLFLSISLTARKLALYGELDVISACGIAPLRWMRLPLILTAMVSLLSFLNQGWLIPAGEVQLEEIGQRMELGEFGRRLPAGQFIDLGPGKVLQFQRIDETTGDLIDLFLKTEKQTFSAKRGRLSRLSSGRIKIELQDGQAIDVQEDRVLYFSQFEYLIGEATDETRENPRAVELKQMNIAALWAKGTDPERAAVYGRCLWAALALFLPSLALVLGKPPRRQSGAGGIVIGMLVLVIGLKMISPLIGGQSSHPELLATGILLAWGCFGLGLIRAERTFGQGFVDLWINRALRNTHGWVQKTLLQINASAGIHPAPISATPPAPRLQRDCRCQR